jgi:hypothetical protein
MYLPKALGSGTTRNDQTDKVMMRTSGWFNLSGAGASLVLSVMGLANPAGAESRTVQQLFSECEAGMNNEGSVFNYGYCLGAVAGVSQVMAANCDGGKSEPSLAWLSASLPPSHGAGVQAFVNWAEAHPEQWGAYELTGVILAIRQTFPCK